MGTMRRHQREAQEGHVSSSQRRASPLPSRRQQTAQGTGHGDCTHCCRTSGCVPAQGTQAAAEERPCSPVNHGCVRVGSGQAH